jgi:hypothetical protein
MLGRLILFFASAVVVACGAYFVAHDTASFCNATIRVDSLIGAGGLSKPKSNRVGAAVPLTDHPMLGVP